MLKLHRCVAVTRCKVCISTPDANCPIGGAPLRKALGNARSQVWLRRLFDVRVETVPQSTRRCLFSRAAEKRGELVSKAARNVEEA